MSKTPHLLDGCGMTPSRQLAILTAKLSRCLEHHAVLTVPPSVLAASLLSLELEMFSADWLAATLWLQSLIHTDNFNLIRCREQLSRHLEVNLSMTDGHFMYNPPTPSVPSPASQHQGTPLGASCSGATKRKVEQMEVDHSAEDLADYDIYDGIKRLYSEDSDMPIANTSSCGLELQQLDKITASPPHLTVAANWLEGNLGNYVDCHHLERNHEHPRNNKKQQQSKKRRCRSLDVSRNPLS